MDRKKTTEFLKQLLIEKVIKPGVYGASEVSIDWGTINVKYVDYMTFDPANTYSVSGLEKGIFTCYEIKSCYEDLYSGKGLNFIGEKNYIVTTAETFKKMLDDAEEDFKKGITNSKETKLNKHILSVNPESKCVVGFDVGVLVALPLGRSLKQEMENQTPLNADLKWKLHYAHNCRTSSRKRSLTEMLFYMMRATQR